MADELLSSFDHLKSLSTSKGNNNLLQKRNPIPVEGLVGNNKLLKSLNPVKCANEQFGLLTVTDIVRELEKPECDRQPEFSTVAFKEGVVINVAALGTFIDIGVHQDGLVHISALANKFVEDPHTVGKVGQVVKVKVLEVDEKRKRSALTMRLTDAPVPQAQEARGTGKREQPRDRKDRSAKPQQKRESTPNTAMAAVFARLKG